MALTPEQKKAIREAVKRDRAAGKHRAQHAEDVLALIRKMQRPKK